MLAVRLVRLRQVQTPPTSDSTTSPIIHRRVCLSFMFLRFRLFRRVNRCGLIIATVGPARKLILGHARQLAMLVDGQALPGRTSWTAFVGKVNSGGTVEWLRSIPAETMYEIGVYFAFSSRERGVALSDGGVMVASRYLGKLAFGSTTFTNASSSEYQFLAKFDGADTAQWAITSGSAGLYYVNSVFAASGDRFRMLARASGQAVSFPGITPVSATAEDAVLIEFGPPENPPFISMTPAGNKIILAWPATANGFGLEWATKLPPTGWTSNSAVPVVVGGNLTVTNPISGGAKFYRLKK
jgi:hypothetical protein